MIKNPKQIQEINNDFITPKEADQEESTGQKKKIYLRGFLKKTGIDIDQDVLNNRQDVKIAAKFFENEDEIRVFQSQIKEFMQPTKKNDLLNRDFR